MYQLFHAPLGLVAISAKCFQKYKGKLEALFKSVGKAYVYCRSLIIINVIIIIIFIIINIIIITLINIIIIIIIIFIITIIIIIIIIIITTALISKLNLQIFYKKLLIFL